MRLLLVEDSARLAGLLVRALQEQLYAVDHATSAENAAWMARATEYDGLIVDVMLPGASGVELCRTLRADGIATPLLMLTSLADVEDRITGLDAGADDYLAKPFDIDELFARVRALVRRGASSTSTSPVLAVGELRLDPAAHEVLRSGELLELSAKEYEVLEALMRNAGRVLTRFDILEHAWDMGAEHSSNVIDVYIRNLRAKVDKPYGSHAIETVRGVGYRLATNQEAWCTPPSPAG